MRLSPLLGAVLALSAIGAAHAAELPPIREFPLATVERLGRDIYRQDRAAWVATDVLVARVPDLKAAHLLGWIVEEAGTGQRVRSLRDAGAGLEAGYDIDVSADFLATFSEPADRRLTDLEVAMWKARKTAAAGLAGAEVCRPGYNAVVLPDPEQAGWLVWMLAPMPRAGVIPVGIHYRFTISADGSSVLRRDALTRACGDLDPRQGAKDRSTPEAVAITHIVSPTPVETEVFLQLQSGIAMYLITAGQIWTIQNGAVRQVDPKPK